ncbi:MAG: peptidylprolyl isomerase [Pirellulaceae bacterium]|nr:MAG: peptidylprolyl isomerase [Pirellulaceae bacterium]
MHNIGWPVIVLALLPALVLWAEPFEEAKIVARVGDEVILLGDVLGPVNMVLAPYRDRLPEAEFQQQRELLLEQHVRVAVENKLLYLAFLRDIPPDKKSEALPKIWQEVHRRFDESELPQLLEKHRVASEPELDAFFRQFGWSLAKQRRMYGERALGMAGLYQKVDLNPVVTHQELLAYYQQHLEEYSFPARARWEELAVRFDRFRTREEAYQAIVAMGNEVLLGGAPLWAVAKRSSQGFTARDGGQHDWTSQGSLASEALDRALFELPVGQLSPIIEDETGYHIIRVLERHGPGRTPFTEVQKEIKKKLQEEKRKAAIAEYVERLRREIPVWTIYDGPSGS